VSWARHTFNAAGLREYFYTATTAFICRTPPCGFEAKLKEAYPILHQKLKSAGKGQHDY